MSEKDVAAMENGVRNSQTVIAVLSEVYFTRPYCIKELEWAQDAGVSVCPVMDVFLKPRIGQIHQRPRALIQHPSTSVTCDMVPYTPLLSQSPS